MSDSKWEYEQWLEHRQELSELEVQGVPVDPEDWQQSDDEAVRLLGELARRLGW